MAKRQLETMTVKKTSTGVRLSVIFFLATGIVSLILAGLSWFFQASAK